MIKSTFPVFEPLTVGHKADIESFTSKFPPYSDFNFTSLYCWNTNGCVAVSTLNGNLVVRFCDYLTGLPLYSFLGDQKTGETALALLALSKEEGLEPQLKLVPEVAVAGMDPATLTVTEDEDNADYLLPIDKLTSYAGNRLGGKRNFVNRFKAAYSWETRLLDLSDAADQKAIMDMFAAWADGKGLDASFSENERKALTGIFPLAKVQPLLTPAIFVGDQLAGFAIVEPLGGGDAILHFEKADAKGFVGIYQMVMMETARILAEKGCTTLNYEQDLGIAGLRKTKKSFTPSGYLRKYRVVWNGAAK